MKFDDWVNEIPEDTLNDPLWKFETYRKAGIFAAVTSSAKKYLNTATIYSAISFLA